MCHFRRQSVALHARAELVRALELAANRFVIPLAQSQDLQMFIHFGVERNKNGNFSIVLSIFRMF